MYCERQDIRCIADPSETSGCRSEQVVLTEVQLCGNGQFMTVLDSFSKSAEEFYCLHALYMSTSSFQRKTSKLKDSIRKANEGLAGIKKDLISISSIKISLSSALTLTTMARANEKLLKMTELLKTLLHEEKNLQEAIRHLMRRNSGIAHSLEADITVQTFICHSVVNGKECGLVFSSRHYLQKHQKQAGHKVSRGRRRV